MRAHVPRQRQNRADRFLRRPLDLYAEGGRDQADEVPGEAHGVNDRVVRREARGALLRLHRRQHLGSFK